MPLIYICYKAENAVRYGINVLVLSDRKMSKERAPIPSLLATGAVHHHLIRKGLRVKCGIVVEAGDIRETQHYATLIGYGASAINPYLTFETLYDLKVKNVFTKDMDKMRYLTATSRPSTMVA